MTCGIYCITNKEGKRYIGKSVNIEKRILQHGNRYGQTPKVTVLQECKISELNDLECYWCFKLKSELNKCIPYVDQHGKKRWANIIVRRRWKLPHPTQEQL